MKYFSLFSGIGGFELGIQQAHKFNHNQQQPTCIGYSEVDKYAIQIYEKHFKHKSYGDIAKINAAELPDFDLLVGGFPCQAFSVAGKRKGFSDTRGTLFFEIIRIAREKQPRLLLLENVKGLLSHDKGNTFFTIIALLDELGYGCEWQVLNSKNFGVPQSRERVFIVGYLRGTGGPKIFPLAQNSQANHVIPTLTARYCAGQANGAYLRQISPKGSSQGGRVYDPKGLSVTLASQAGGLGAKTGLYAIPVLTPDRAEKRQNGRRMKDNGEPMFTLTSQDRHGVYDGVRIRRLTPLECERLQGFPDNWTAGISDSQRYKCLGNAVTVNVVREITKSLLAAHKLNFKKEKITNEEIKRAA